MKGTLLLEINRNFPSGEWSTIATTPVMTRGYSWTVNGPVSELCRIRVSLVDSGFAPISDISDANFTIIDTPNPTIQVAIPNGGEHWTIGTPVIMHWMTPILAGNATIQLNRNYPNGEWTTLGQTLVAYETFQWTVTGPASSLCRVRVMVGDSAGTTISDISDSNFAIVNTVPNPIITVTAPNGNEVWPLGNRREITWNYKLGIPMKYPSRSITIIPVMNGIQLPSCRSNNGSLSG